MDFALVYVLKIVRFGILLLYNEEIERGKTIQRRICAHLDDLSRNESCLDCVLIDIEINYGHKRWERDGNGCSTSSLYASNVTVG